MTSLDRSHSSIGVAVTCLTTQRVIYLKIKVKGLTAVTVFAYHVIFAPAVGQRKAEQTIQKTSKAAASTLQWIILKTQLCFYD